MGSFILLNERGSVSGRFTLVWPLSQFMGAADFVLRSLSAGDIDRTLSTEIPELSKRTL